MTKAPSRESQAKNVGCERFDGASLVSVVPITNPLREAGAAAAQNFWRGSPSHRMGFNGGVAWTLAQIKHAHPECWDILEKAWQMRPSPKPPA